MKLDKQHPLYQEDLRNVLSTKGMESLRGKSVLVTGATGLLGVHLIDVLMMLGGVKVYAVGRSLEKAAARLGEYLSLDTTPEIDITSGTETTPKTDTTFGAGTTPVGSTLTFLEQDVCAPFPEDLKVDYIIPGASNTHPLAYSQYPVETIMINIKGAENALELAARCGATVLYPSTVEVYGNALAEDDVFTEDYTGRLNLSTSRACYTESKRVCEAMCQSYKAQKGVDVKIVRLSRIFGPTMLESDSKASSQFIKKAIAGEDIVLKSKGEQYFSYTYVSDAVAAMLHVMIGGTSGTAYNVANSKCNVHLKDFARMCAQACGKDVVFDLPSETELKGYSVAMQAILDETRLLSTGFMPRYDMRDAVERTIKILSGNE